MRLAVLALGLLFALSASAQPASHRLAEATPVEVLSLAVASNDALAATARAARTGGPAPVRFAEPVDVAVTPQTHGTWTVAGDGTRVWRLVVESPTAYSLSFGFSRFRLPPGAALWIYAPGQAPEYRPFTAADNEAHGQLWTPIVVGDRAVIELNVPPSKTPLAVELELAQANHAFLPTLLAREEKDALGARLSGSCNVDVACPQGDAYGDLIRSVGAYTVGGVDYCSGTAVNTTAEDDRPLFLTAEHCGIGPSNGAAVVVYWNYQNTRCRTPGSAESGSAGNGPRYQFNTGAREVGANAASDWSLLELDDPFVTGAGVYLSGWDRRDQAPTSAVGIHHPGVEEKRISFENDPLTITTYGSAVASPTGTHLRVIDWDLGTTEGGSSGSALFSPEGRIVGQLHGGGAACGNDQSDWYGRLARSMADGLAPLLDPLGTGTETHDGRDFEPAMTRAVASVDQAAVGDRVAFTFSVVNFSAQPIQAEFTNPLPSALALAGTPTASVGVPSVADGVVRWSGTVPAESEVAIRYEATVLAAGALTNTASSAIPGFPDLPAQARVFATLAFPTPDTVVEAVVGTAIPDNGCSSFVGSTLDVTGPLVIEHLAVGVGITHTWRGDLRVRLTSPAGTTVSLIERVGAGGSGSNADNLDVLIGDEGAPGSFASGNHNVGAPFYDVVGAPESGAPGGPVGTLASFIGEDAAGTWTLGVCDGAAQDTGRLERWSLQFVSSGAVAGEAGPAGAFTARLSGPNPTGTRTALALAVPGTQHVRATLVDATGRTVATVFDGPVAESAEVAVDVSDLAAGVYLVRVEAGASVRTQRLTVVR